MEKGIGGEEESEDGHLWLAPLHIQTVITAEEY